MCGNKYNKINLVIPTWTNVFQSPQRDRTHDLQIACWSALPLS